MIAKTLEKISLNFMISSRSEEPFQNTQVLFCTKTIWPTTNTFGRPKQNKRPYHIRLRRKKTNYTASILFDAAKHTAGKKTVSVTVHMFTTAYI